MNIPIIQKFFIKKIIEHNNLKNKTVNTNKINKILLLLDITQLEIKTNIVNILKANGLNENHISFLVYIPTLEKNKVYENPTFSNNSFTFFGKIKSEELKKATSIPYDLLISFSENENLYLDMVSQEIKADFKVGLNDFTNKTNNLIVNCKLNRGNLYLQETIKYLKILNKI